MSDPTKGAFKHLLPEKQPQRIPLPVIPQLEQKLISLFGHLGDLHFPNSLKKSKKEDIGDLDVLFVPKIPHWKEQIILRTSTIGVISNSAQLMTVMDNLLGDGNRYMIDFLIVKKGGLEFKKLFYGYGTGLSALLGSFARSIGYKFTDYALYKRVKNERGQWKNILLTNKPDVALMILGLDPTFINDDALYTPEGLAAWIACSPRYDTESWLHGNPDKIGVGIPLNKNARDAIRKKDDVSDAYDLLSLHQQNGDSVSPDFTYEDRILGLAKTAVIKVLIAKKIVNSAIILNGNEIMELLKITPGPEIGRLQKLLAKHFKHVPAAERQSESVKEAAKRLILEEGSIIMLRDICS